MKTCEPRTAPARATASLNEGMEPHAAVRVGQPPPVMVSFAGGSAGGWRVDWMKEVRGPGLERVDRVAVVEGSVVPVSSGARWVLRGVTSNERYVTRPEHEALLAIQGPLGRPTATRAALIPIKKSADWWALAQDERRAILEERSHHIATGIEYLPSAADAFEELVGRLRATEEWAHVEREVDIRLTREPSTEILRSPSG